MVIKFNYNVNLEDRINWIPVCMYLGKPVIGFVCQAGHNFHPYVHIRALDRNFPRPPAWNIWIKLVRSEPINTLDGETELIPRNSNFSCHEALESNQKKGPHGASQ